MFTKTIMILRTTMLLLMQCLLATTSLAAPSPLDKLLSQSTPPAGVVFEIADRDPRALDLMLPWVKQAAQQLKARFPGLPMALVTHGQEMFALQSESRDQHATAHQLVQSISRDEGIAVHVCEIYAGWRGIAPEAFPDYVDVAPSGPAQIRNYEALDYVRVVVPKAPSLQPR